MERIEQLLDSKDIRVTAMRLLIYKFLAEKEIAVTSGCEKSSFDQTSPVPNAFNKHFSPLWLA